MRSGSSESAIRWVYLDPEAERFVGADPPDTIPGGTIGTRRGALRLGVSESVGGRDAPPGMRSVKVAVKRPRK